jgi:hypothetical protein
MRISRLFKRLRRCNSQACRKRHSPGAFRICRNAGNSVLTAEGTTSKGTGSISCWFNFVFFTDSVSELYGQRCSFICFTFMWPTVHRNKFLCNKTNQMHQFTKFTPTWNSTCFGQFLCPSSGVYSLYTQHWYMSYRFGDRFRAGPGWNWAQKLGYISHLAVPQFLPFL